MATRQDIQIADDLVKSFNAVCSAVDNIIAASKDEDIFGNQLNADVSILKETIAEENTNGVLGRNTAITSFLAGHNIEISLQNFTDRTISRYNTDRGLLEQKSKTINSAVEEITDIEVLKTEGAKHINNVIQSRPVKYGTAYRYANIINDLLDASSYILNGINPDNGMIFDGDLKERVLMYLNQIPQFNLGVWPMDIDDVNDMVEVANSVINDISTHDVLILAKRIDDNVPKLPLIRRNWAL